MEEFNFSDFNDYGSSGFDSSSYDMMDYGSSGYGSSANPEDILAGLGLASGVGLIIAIIVGLIVLVVTIYLLSRYFGKMGYSPWLSLLILLNIIPIIGPLVVLGLYIYFAVVEWPVEKELKKLKGGGEKKMEEKSSAA